MLTLILAAVWFDAPPDLGKRPTVAMVLKVKGDVTLRPLQRDPRRLEVMDMLGAGDRITLADGASAVLVFAHEGRKEELRPSAPVTVEETGCTPRDAVTLMPSKQSKQT